MADASALREYAQRHGLTYETGKSFTTGSLVRFRQASDHSLTGALPGGLWGTIALMTYSGEGGASHETLCVAEVPESIAFLPKLYCRDSHFKHTRSYTLGSEGFASDWRGTEFESEAVNRTWAVQVAPDQDEGWLRELFAPTFLDWLGQHSPEDFTFELHEGQLTCRVDGEVDDEAGLDRLIELTTHIAERIRTESMEEERAPAPFSAPLPPPEPTAEREATDRAVARRDWNEPPRDMATAISGYRGVARREPGGWKAPLLLGGGIGGLILVIGVPVSLASGGLSDFGAFAAGSTAITFLLLAVGLGGFLFWAARRSQVQKRALLYGQRAFVVEYARSRGLEHEDPKAFHARFLRLDLPGPARNVMYGRHPATGRETRLLLCSDPSGQSAGFEVAVVPTAGLTAGAAAGTEQNVAVSVDDGYVVASKPAPSDAGPSIEDLDAVARRASDAAGGAAATSSSVSS
jgi:hypothetical protein